MSLLSDFEGHAGELLLLTPCSADHLQPLSLLAGQVGNLLPLLAENCKVYWACASRHIPQAPFEIDGRQVVPVQLSGIPAASDHARWVQDPILIHQTDAGRRVLQPVPPANTLDSPNRFAVDTALARALAQALQCPVLGTSIAAEGGNVMRLADHLLLGRDIGLDNGIARSGPHLNPGRQDWEILGKRALEEFGGEKVVWVGCERMASHGLKGLAIKSTPSWQPLFHLDLFMLPGGKGPDGQLRLFIGKIQNLETQSIRPEDLQSLQLLQAMLDEVETSLRQQISGVEIAHLPIMASVHEGSIAIESLCNGWVEVGSQGRLAFLPDYRTHPHRDQYAVRRAMLHDLAADTLAHWGFETRWVDMDFPNLSRHAGALHCAIKILSRTP